jgi:hypothetical protein
MKLTRSGIGLLSSLAITQLASMHAQAAPTSFTGSNKPSSRLNVTSMFVYIKPNGTQVTPPAGWTDAGTGPGSNVHHFVGGSIPPGGSATFNANNPHGTTTASLVGGDYSDGKVVGMCPDPVSGIAVPGGETGGSYLGYPIPAHQWGYFYTVWNYPDFNDVTQRTRVVVGKEAGAYNFQVINNSFSPQTLDELVPQSETNSNYQFAAPYMDPSNALGVAGVQTNLNFNAATSLLTMDFTGGRTGGGIGAGQSSSIAAYTSPYEPGFSDNENTSSDFVTFGTCPGSGYNFTVVPSPEPGSALALACGAAALLQRRRAR